MEHSSQSSLLLADIQPPDPTTFITELRTESDPQILLWITVAVTGILVGRFISSLYASR